MWRIGMLVWLFAAQGRAQPGFDPEEAGRLCSKNLVTVDVPVSAAIPKSHDQTSRTAIGQIRAHLQAGWASWFEGCDVSQRRVEFIDLMERLPMTLKPGCHPATGACRRHQRLQFYCNGGGALEITNTCEVIRGIRDVFHQASGNEPAYLSGDTFYVARDCDARHQQAAFGGWPVDWHRPVVLPNPGGAAPAPGVRVVALENTMSTHAGRVADAIKEFAQPAPWLVGQLDAFIGVHGTPTSQVARALAHIVKSSVGVKDPIVVNISLAWPPEFSRPWKLKGCAAPDVIESPAGEAVRYALAVLSHRARNHRGNGRPTIILAAVGNRQAQIPISDYQGANGQCDRSACKLFYPAAWGTIQTAIHWEPAPRPLLQSVGQAGLDGVEPVHRRTSYRASLYAPGSALLLAGRPNEILSGTSYATALAASLAAKALHSGLGDANNDGWLDGRDFVKEHTCIGPSNNDAWLRWQGGQAGCPASMVRPIPLANPAFVQQPCLPGSCCVGGAAVRPVFPCPDAGPPQPFLPDQFHQRLAALPQPATPVCPETTCIVAVQDGFAKLDFSATINTVYPSQGTAPDIVNDVTHTPVLRLYQNGNQVAAWTLTHTSWGDGGTLPFNNLVIPSGHQDSNKWAAGEYKLKLESWTTDGGTQTYYNLDSLLLDLP